VTIRLPAILDDEEIAVRLLAEHGVAVHPGFLFDLPHQSSLVFSLLTPIPVWTRALEVMLAALDEWLAGS